METRVLRIVVASPGDVRSERESLDEVIAEVNRGIAADRGLRMELVRWETDAYPGFHPEGPQGLIDPILKIENCDILVGIFWTRFGTPTGDSASGTEHEFRQAYKSWKLKGRPNIMVYFNQAPYTAKSKAETDQWGLVLDFQTTFPKEGLWWPYEGKDSFAKQVRHHLTNFIRREYALPTPNEPAVAAPGEPSASAPSGKEESVNKKEPRGHRINAARLVRQYQNSLSTSDFFAGEVVRRQLQLFADLGIRQDLAAAVLAALDKRVPAPRQDSAGRIDVVVFSGHPVDAESRVRFPREREIPARKAIHDAVRGILSADRRFQGLASGAPGADILFHEVCEELGVRSTLCLPMPASQYAQSAFPELDDWRNRFLALVRKAEVLELSNLAGLPRWLHGADVDLWERANRWVMEMALAWQADKVTLLALWNGEDTGERPGGTAQMIRLARESGRVDVVVIDSRKLLV